LLRGKSFDFGPQKTVVHLLVLKKIAVTQENPGDTKKARGHKNACGSKAPLIAVRRIHDFTVGLVPCVFFFSKRVGGALGGGACKCAGT